MRFAVRFTGSAARTRDDLPGPARRALDDLVERLASDPFLGGAPAEAAAEHSATFGRGGVLEYAVHTRLTTVSVIRIVYMG
ncbi:hypothetical protein [Stackebrandtia albiflava]|uniref:hypothetical protein n=1 Tax=Stackebrandtia albiflava TaxID=406432 RepID=UPI0011BFB560|nr:hypothetical protein [Stackebrandtia albiflava]